MLHIFLRTCSKYSLEQNRILPKDEILKACLLSLIDTIKFADIEYNLTIIDDNSNDEIKQFISYSTEHLNCDIHFLPERQEDHLPNKAKSRYSVKYMYDLLENGTFNEDDLIYIVEDDYLHYQDSIQILINSFNHFKELLDTTVGIFPQDFPQLYFDKKHQFNSTYIQPCHVFPGPDRYFRTTWFSQESFMVEYSTIIKYLSIFRELETIGFVEGNWEGNTISNIWKKLPMLMPMKTLAIHMSNESDISYFTTWEPIFRKYSEFNF